MEGGSPSLWAPARRSPRSYLLYARDEIRLCRLIARSDGPRASDEVALQFGVRAGLLPMARERNRERRGVERSSDPRRRRRAGAWPCGRYADSRGTRAIAENDTRSAPSIAESFVHTYRKPFDVFAQGSEPGDWLASLDANYTALWKARMPSIQLIIGFQLVKIWATISFMRGSHRFHLGAA
jgi:hypothetical protein